ncbi:pregnancy zone protein-like [Diadema antillarum]|uniref:pregnancy zone protein-like n=1 Tax=Diadema antillarum TaxID=105358 RepID=UPI003A88C280
MRTLLISAVLCLAFTGGVWCDAPDDQCGFKYLVTSPKILLAGTTERICVNLLDEVDIDFSLSLREEFSWWRRDTAGEPQNLTVSDYSMSSKRECFDFEVPRIDNSRQNAKLIFRARESNQPDDAFVCDSEKSILISEYARETLIQTDKPIYKPGQTVKFRIMSIDKDFKTDNSTIPLIWIESPTGVRLAQWDNEEPEMGLVDLEFPMTTEPLLGDWSIIVDLGDREARTSFTVDEYVLPKYEVTASGPSYLSLVDTSAEISVCAKYTYGQSVRGSVIGEVNIKPYYRYNTGRPSVPFDGELGGDGCYTFEVDLSDLEMMSTEYSIWSSKLTVDATVIDSVTGEELTESMEICSISFDPLSIQINVPSSFKPGVPFFGTISVTNPDDTPAANKFITLVVQSATKDAPRNYGELLRKNYTTPESGNVAFSIDDVDIETTSLDFFVEAPGYEKGNRSDYEQYHVYNPYASSQISAQFSPSGSFLQIEPIQDTLAIGSTKTVDLKFTSDDPDADKNTQFFFAFMSLGDVLDVPVSMPAAMRRRRQVDEEERSVGTPECEGDLVLNSCGTACPLICGEPEPEICTLQCVSGCACPAGLYRDSSNGTRCLAAENCTTSDIDLVIIDESGIDYSFPIIFPEEVDVNITEPGQLFSAQRSFTVTAAMSPVTSMLVYFIRPNGEVVADSLKFEVEGRLANEVALDFADDEVKPGESTTMKVTSQANSLCGLGIVDKSVHILGGDNSITSNKLIEAVRRYQLERYGMFYDSSSSCQDSRRRRRKRTSVPYFYGGGSSFEDSSKAFKDIGMLYLTNMDVETKPCRTFPQVYYRTGFDGPLAAPIAQENIVQDSISVGPQEAPAVQVRSYFPETFLWDLVKTNTSGLEMISLQTPHTITEWVANGFCISPENGLGVAPSASFRTFQPFFLTFSLPYSVIRGENVPITVSVFNYLEECLVVRLTLQESSEFELLSGSRSRDICVCGGDGASVEFRIRPDIVGQMALEVHGESVQDSDTMCGNKTVSEQTGAQDAIRRQLLVKAEGVPDGFTISEYICLQDHRHRVFDENYRNRKPTSYVDDSVSGKIVVTGDMLGPTVDNLEHLIRLPTGCGEQNMLGFVPNIVTLEYLTATNQLEPDVEKKLKSNMQVGYQRELNYRHPDGSYSAFGGRDGSGNTWLTAFVVRSLAQASKFIFVDEKDLNVSIEWLKDHQDEETGCIESVGYLGYKAMMGGVTGQSMLTAYVVVTYLEAGLPPTDAYVVKGLQCAMADLGSVEDNYALSQIAYALAMASRTEEATKIMEKLEGRSVKQGGITYWTNNRPSSLSLGSYYRAPADSITIEINSYIILTEFLRFDSATARSAMASTVRWLISKQGGQGGFVSTQDTIMGLTALAKYAAGSSTQTAMGVEVALLAPRHKFQHRFTVTQGNLRVQQEQPFKKFPVETRIRSRGHGCALVQVVVNYNVYPDESQSSFALKSSAVPLESKKGNCHNYRIFTRVSYTGSDEESNMALVTVVPPSGFYPIKSSLESLLMGNSDVKRYEINGEQVNFYFDSLNADGASFEFDVSKEFDVQQAKPGYVTVTDYYEKSLSESVPLNLTCDPSSELLLPPDMIPPPPPPRPQISIFVERTDIELPPQVNERDPGAQPDREEDPAPPAPEPTDFDGFGNQQSVKEEDREPVKPVEATEDKPGTQVDKDTSDDKEDGQPSPDQDSDDEARKDGDSDSEGPAGKPTKPAVTVEQKEEEPSAQEEKDGDKPSPVSPTEEEEEDDSEMTEEMEIATEIVTEQATVFVTEEEEQGQRETTPELDVEEEEAGTEMAELRGTMTMMMSPEAAPHEIIQATVVTEEIEVVEVTQAQAVEVTQAQAMTTEAVDAATTAFDAEAQSTTEADFDECTVENICGGPEYKCVNFPGTYECQCADGYVMDENGSCHGCAYCSDQLPEDGLDRFCSSTWGYVVKRRKKDLRLLKEKRYSNVAPNGRVYRNFNVADSYCQCDLLLQHGGERFFIFTDAGEDNSVPLVIDNRSMVLPFTSDIVDEVDSWRNGC